MAEGCQGRSARRGVTGVSTLRTKGEGALGKPIMNLHLKNGFIKKTRVLATTLTSFYQLNLTFVFVYTTSIKRGEFGTSSNVVFAVHLFYFIRTMFIRT